MTDHDVCEKQRANGNSAPTHTRITLLAYIRDLQLRCLSHLPLDW